MELEGLMDDHVTKMVCMVESEYATIQETKGSNSPCNKVLNLSRTVTYLLADITSCLSFGRCFGCVERQGDFHGYIETSESKLPIVLSIAILPFHRNVGGGRAVWG